MNRGLFLVFVLAWAAVARADDPPPGVGFTQRPGARLPLDTRWVDSSGAPRRLGDCFRGRPVVLYFGYARCAQLCAVVADGTVAALRQIKPAAGLDFDVVSISLDPTETPAEGKRRQTDAVRRYGQAGDAAGWHFLTGSAEAVRSVADAAGFGYAFDARSGQYAHPSGFLVITPDGVVSAYFLGVDFAPAEVARALARARRGQTGGSVADLLLLCFRGGAIGGRYGALAWRGLEWAVVLTVVTLGGAIGWMLREEFRGRRGGGARP